MSNIITPHTINTAPNKRRRKCGGRVMNLPESDMAVGPYEPMRQCLSCGAISRNQSPHCENYIYKAKTE